MNRIMITCLILCCALRLMAFQSESNASSYHQVIPPSPTAASLGKYGEYQVNGSSGVPDVSVPLFEVNGNTMSLPVSLSYHGSGNKVTDVASWVGLGWSLNAGGVVTRTIIGNADEDGNGINAIYSQGFDPDDFHPDTNENDYNLFRAMAKQGWTADPDIYSFNVMGISGQFFIDLNGEIHLFSAQDVTIRRVAGNGFIDRFLIVTNDGTQFEFAEKEFTSNITDTTCGLQVSSSERYISSWYLTKILHEYEEFTFNYLDETITHSLNKSYSESVNVSGTTGCPGPSSCETSHFLTIDKKKLHTIVGPFGVATFDSNKTRLDLNGGTALESISYQGIIVNLETKFETSHTEGWNTFDDFDKSRLILEAVSIEAGSEDPKRHEFKYNARKLPSRDTFGVDHYGYYNGGSALSPFPPIENYFPDGTSREVNEPFAKAEVLEEITYPTGGKTLFNWESNRVSLNATNTVERDLSAIIYDDRSYFMESYSKTFTVGHSQTGKLVYRVGSHWSVDEPGDINVYIRNMDTNALIFSENLTQNGTRLFNLVPGNYKLSAFNQGIHFEYLNLRVEYTELVTDVEDATIHLGGLRISSIVNLDSDGTELTRNTYAYSDPSVTNKVINSDYFSTSFSYSTSSSPSGFNLITGECQTGTRSSNSRFALSSSVSYAEITQFVGSIDDHEGYTIKVFHTDQDNGGGTLGTPLHNQSWKRNILKEELFFNKEENLVRKVMYNYEFIPRAHFSGVRVAFLKDDPTTDLFPLSGNDELSWRIYDRKSEWGKLVSVESTDYFEGGQSISTESNYIYFHPDLHLNPNKITTVDSQDKEWVNITLYPRDFSDVNGSINSLKGNYSGLPIEKSVYFKEANTGEHLITSSISNVYNVQGDLVRSFSAELSQPVVKDLFLVAEEGTSLIDYELSDNYPEKPEIELSYYGNGRIKELKERSLVTTFLWGYKNRYPVAKVINIDHQQLSSLVGHSILDNLRNANNSSTIRQLLMDIREDLPLSIRMESTLYEPGIGVNEMIDINGQSKHYRYDNFNRLYQIVDHENNVLEQYEYNYSSNQ